MPTNPAEKSQVAARLFNASLCILLVLASFNETQSYAFRVIRGEGCVATASLFILLALAVLAGLDTVLNDVLCERWRVPLKSYWRQLLWMGIATTLAAYSFLLLRHGLGVWTVSIYFVFSIRAATIAFIDLHVEHNRRCGITLKGQPWS